MIIIRPQILFRRRSSEGEVSIGDEVKAAIRPGLLRFLRLRDGERYIGDTWSPEYSVPLAAAATSSHEVLHPGPDSPAWAPWTYTANWLRPMRDDEAVVGSVRVSRLTPSARITEFELRSSTRHDLLCSGTAVAAASRPSSSVPSHETPATVVPPDSVIEESLARFDQVGEPLVDLLDLSPPFRLTDESSGELTWQFSPGLLHLLVNPVGGHTDPLGRRSHPLGAFHLGAAVHAAREAIGRPAPLIRFELILHAPLQLPSPPLLLRLTRTSTTGGRDALPFRENRFFSSLVQNDVVVSTARLRLGGDERTG